MKPTGGYTFEWKPKTKCVGCGGKVNRPVHIGSKESSIYCSAACRKGMYQKRWAENKPNVGVDLASGEDETTYLAPQPQQQTFSIGIDKPGLLAAFESRVRAGDEASPKIYNALAQSLQPGVQPHEWAFNRNQECYWCPKCGATIDLALVQHTPEIPWELFKGRCRGIPLVETKTTVVAVAEKAEEEFIGEPKEPERPGRVIKFEEEV